MTQDAQGKTAKIYKFPVGGRAGLQTARETAKRVEVRPVRAAKIVHGSSWYHEQAVMDEAQEWKR